MTMRRHKHEIDSWLGVILSLSLTLGLAQVVRGVVRGWGDLPLKGMETLTLLGIAVIAVWVSALNERDGR